MVELQGDCREMPWEVAQGILLMGLYKTLPLHGVNTTYEGTILRLGDHVIMFDRSRYNDEFEFCIDQSVVAPLRAAEWTKNHLARQITDKHPGKWTAFSAQVFVENNQAKVLYGIKTLSQEVFEHGEPVCGKSVIETLLDIRKQVDEVLRKINGHPNP